MAFRFPLETLLRVKLGLERQQELRLQEANLRVASLTRQIEGVQQALNDIELGQRSALQSATSGAELHFAILCRTALQASRQALEKQLSDAQILRGSCIEKLQQARREREAIDTLRRHQLQNYHRQEARLDQRRLDDLYLLRREYLRRR